MRRIADERRDVVTEHVAAAELDARRPEAVLAEVPDALARRSRRSVVVVLVALGAGIAAHLPGLFRPLFDSDEAAIATLGAGITRGGVLYRDLIDRKPPLAPLLYAVGFLVTGSHSIVTLRVVLGLEVGIAALVIGYEAARITGSRTSGWWAGGLLVLGAVAFRPVAGQAANYSQLALLPGCVAIVAARRGTRTAALVGGLALGLAVLTRQTWLLGLAPAMLGVWSHGDRRIERLAILVATMALTICAVGVFMPFGAFWHWTFSGNSDLLAVRQSQHIGQRLVESLGPFVIAHVVAIGLALRRGVRRSEFDLWLWLAVGVVAFAIGFRFFDHYWFQALGPLCLLAGLAAPSVRTSLRWLLILLVVVSTAFWWSKAWSAHGFGKDWSPVLTLIASQTRSGDRITVWGAIPELYWRSDRDPGGALVTSDFVVGRTAGRTDGPQRLVDAEPGALAAFLASLRADPPVLFLDTSTANFRSYGHYPLRLVPAVDDFVRAHYKLIGTSQGITIWHLRDR